MEKIILQSFWAGHGEPKIAAYYYRQDRLLGRETVIDEEDARVIAEKLYGFTGEYEVEVK